MERTGKTAGVAGHEKSGQELHFRSLHTGRVHKTLTVINTASIYFYNPSFVPTNLLEIWILVTPAEALLKNPSSTMKLNFSKYLTKLSMQSHTIRCPFQLGARMINAKVKALQNIGTTAKPTEFWLVGTCRVYLFL